jgi:hypothetical protein
LLEVIFRHLDWRPDRLNLELDKPVGVRSRAADNTRVSALAGWEPATPLREGWHGRSTVT